MKESETGKGMPGLRWYGRQAGRQLLTQEGRIRGRMRLRQLLDRHRWCRGLQNPIFFFFFFFFFCFCFCFCFCRLRLLLPLPHRDGARDRKWREMVLSFRIHVIVAWKGPPSCSHGRPGPSRTEPNRTEPRRRTFRFL